VSATATEAPPAAVGPDAVTPRLIGVNDVARLLGVSLTTVERMHAAGKVPAPRRIGARNVWDRVELEEWIARPRADGKMMDRKAWGPVWSALVKAGVR
jgi:excisionase family DNA binding protein